MNYSEEVRKIAIATFISPKRIDGFINDRIEKGSPIQMAFIDTRNDLISKGHRLPALNPENGKSLDNYLKIQEIKDKMNSESKQAAKRFGEGDMLVFIEWAIKTIDDGYTDDEQVQVLKFIRTALNVVDDTFEPSCFLV